MSRKINCWEWMRCGREPGGAREQELGVCPAAVSNYLDGVHDGTWAGRACWVVAGTLCGGRVQGTFAQKVRSCQDCVFYGHVHLAEGPGFVSASTLLARYQTGSWPLAPEVHLDGVPAIPTKSKGRGGEPK